MPGRQQPEAEEEEEEEAIENDENDRRLSNGSAVPRWSASATNAVDIKDPSPPPKLLSPAVAQTTHPKTPPGGSKGGETLGSFESSGWGSSWDPSTFGSEKQSTALATASAVGLSICTPRTSSTTEQDGTGSAVATKRQHCPVSSLGSSTFSDAAAAVEEGEDFFDEEEEEEGRVLPSPAPGRLSKLFRRASLLPPDRGGASETDDDDDADDDDDNQNTTRDGEDTNDIGERVTDDITRSGSNALNRDEAVGAGSTVIPMNSSSSSSSSAERNYGLSDDRQRKINVFPSRKEDVRQDRGRPQRRIFGSDNNKDSRTPSAGNRDASEGLHSGATSSSLGATSSTAIGHRREKKVDPSGRMGMGMGDDRRGDQKRPQLKQQGCHGSSGV